MNEHLSQPSDDPIVARLEPDAQIALLADIAGVLAEAPFFRPVLPRWGTPFSVLMSNCGSLGWMADKSGYRYTPTHPVTGAPWPSIPRPLLTLWETYAHYPHPPEACLINYYAPGAKMGLHQDKDEADFDAPVLSVSLGDSARFRLGGLQRTDPAQKLDLISGDVLLLAGGNRLAFHGIDKLYPDTSEALSRYPDLFPQGGRLNLTLRRVTKPSG